MHRCIVALSQAFVEAILRLAAALSDAEAAAKQTTTIRRSASPPSPPPPRPHSACAATTARPSASPTKMRRAPTPAPRTPLRTTPSAKPPRAHLAWAAVKAAPRAARAAAGPRPGAGPARPTPACPARVGGATLPLAGALSTLLEAAVRLSGAELAADEREKAWLVGPSEARVASLRYVFNHAVRPGRSAEEEKEQISAADTLRIFALAGLVGEALSAHQVGPSHRSTNVATARG